MADVFWIIYGAILIRPMNFTFKLSSDSPSKKLNAKREIKYFYIALLYLLFRLLKLYDTMDDFGFGTYRRRCYRNVLYLNCWTFQRWNGDKLLSKLLQVTA